MKHKVLAIGELLADFISEQYVDNLSEAKSFHMYQGGSAANLCANLKWLGKEADLVACVGNDPIGKFLLNSLVEIGLGTSQIQIHPKEPSSLVMVGKSTGTPDFVAYRYADKMIQKISTVAIANTEIVHSTAFALSLEPARSVVLGLMQKAKELGKQVSCDWNYAPAIWLNDNGRAVFEELCSMDVILKLSLDDFKRFSGNTDAEPEDAIQFLNAYHNCNISLTCGCQGVWFNDEAGNWKFLPAQTLEVKDSTGAGDAYWAGFLAAYTDGLSKAECVQAGIELASLKIQKIGPLFVAS